MYFSQKVFSAISGIARNSLRRPTCLSFRRRNLCQAATMSTIDRNLFILPNESPVCLLDCEEAFKSLSEKERGYAYYMSQASYDGALSVFLQVSPESPALFVTFYRLFKSEGLNELKDKALGVGFSEDEWTAFLVYVSGFYNNSGNYKGFGDSKIIPGVSAKKIFKLLNISAAATKYGNFLQTWQAIQHRVDTLEAINVQLGFPDKGVTTYHSENITKEDVELVSEFLKTINTEVWNSRLIKDRETQEGKTVYRVLFASSEKGINNEYEFNGSIIKIQKGDYSPLMERAAEHLRKANSYTANPEQKNMIEKYVEHFTSGDINLHKDASRYWIKDIGPSVETYIGFIENYRDPAGTRSEFEGFVACVNKETSKKFQELVANAENILPRLPWGAAYEKDKFLKPDFTALDVIAFASSGIPSGINIPNYDEIRQNEGFKNVSLGNVISATPKQKMNFLSEEDENLMFKYYKDSFEVQVGLHELLGHGSGKLFQRNSDGSLNFNANTIDLITGKPVSSWYEPGETWGSKFGQLSSAYEECRAEAVGYVLSCDSDILEIFGFTGETAENVKYVNWLNEIRAGLLALEFYNVEQGKWGQAHCYARYVLLQVCLEAGEGFVKIEELTAEDGKPDLHFTLDRSKIDSVGKVAVNEFLKKLQAYKSTGNFAGGKELFEFYGRVNEEAVRWRDVCIARRKPRRLFVQSNTVLLDSQKVELKSYPATFAGIIESFVERYSEESINDLEKCWENDKLFFPSAYN